MKYGRIPVRMCLEIVAVGGLVACASHTPPPPSPNMAPTGRRVGEFVWQDLMTDDAEKSRKFYEQLFGWTFERTDRLGRPYFIARAGSAAVAGMTQVERQRPDQPVAQWISYLSVSNVDSIVAHNYLSVFVVSILGGYLGIKALDLVLKRFGWST